MTTTNMHGQPVGPPVPDWTPRPWPDGRPLAGRYARLERLTPDHVPALFAALCAETDDPLWTYRFDHRPRDQRRLAELVDRWTARSGEVVYAIAGEAADPAGLATLMRVDPVHGSVEIGSVLFARTLQRTRAATEAVHLLAAHAFDDLGYRRLEWKLDSHNAPSARAARRLGFRYEGRFRQAMVSKGRNRDTDWFALTDADWPAVREAHRRWLAAENFDDGGRQQLALSALTAPLLAGSPVRPLVEVRRPATA